MVRAALASLGLAVAVLVGGQVALPRIAERRITSDLSHSGQVRRVSVEAVPAIKLLFQRADRVEVDMAEVRAGTTGKLVQQLRRSKGTTHLVARADLVTLGPLRLHGAKLTKDHDHLSGQATVSEAELAAALPPQLRVRPIEDASRVSTQTSPSVFRPCVRRARRLGDDDRSAGLPPTRVWQPRRPRLRLLPLLRPVLVRRPVVRLPVPVAAISGALSLLRL